jgi:predicted house-cleaning NTP pyrophosphatase (Maf/HAM1 superfamily)
MFQVTDGDSIILASESTRRVDMLRTLGISFLYYTAQYR